MTRSVLIISNSHRFENLQIHEYFKNSASLKIARLARNMGWAVTCIDHVTAFSKHEIVSIIRAHASKFQDKILCLSTSFLLPQSNPYLKTSKTALPTSNSWGDELYYLIYTIVAEAKVLGYTVCVGGFEVIQNKFFNNHNRVYRWKFEELGHHVDYFIMGNAINVLIRLFSGRYITHLMIGSCRLVDSSQFGEVDFSDISSEPGPNDIVLDKEALPTEIATGCIFSCSFCTYGALGKKKNEFVRSYDSLLREFKYNYETFGTTFYYFTDNLINDYSEKLKMLTRIRESTGIDLRWACYARLDVIKNSQDAQLLYDSGAASLLFGIESFNRTSGPAIGKMCDRDRLIELLHGCREIFKDDVTIAATFISGLPHESIDSVYKTMQWLHSDEGKYLLDDAYWSPLLVPSEHVNKKNTINISRNNPYRDYKVAERADFTGQNWTSPWGTKSDFVQAIQSGWMAHIPSNQRLARTFTMAALVNLGFEPADLVKKIRTDELFDIMPWDRYRTEHAAKIATYKKILLESTFKSC